MKPTYKYITVPAKAGIQYLYPKIITFEWMDTFYVYILTSQRNGTLYIGLTNNLERRIADHKSKTIPGFTSKYNVTMLIYFEEHQNYNEAFTRERQMKKWKRIWKLNLIKKNNPDWLDLSSGWNH